MANTCKNCGASASANSSLHSFICEFCGTKNVDEQYFKDYASKIDVGKANKFLQLGLTAFNGRDYVQAEKHLQECVIEDSQNPEPWIYLAMCKAMTVKASAFESNFAFAKQYIEKAIDIDRSSDLVAFGSIQLGNSYLATSVSAAKYYFDTADKKYFALGEDANAAKQATVEAIKGFEVLKSSFSLNPTDAMLVTSTAMLAIVKCLSFESMAGDNSWTKSLLEFFIEKLLTVYDKREDIVAQELALHPKYQKKILTLIYKKRPKAVAVRKSESDHSVGSHVESSKLPVVKIAIATVVAIVVLGGGYSAYSSHKVEQERIVQKGLEDQRAAEAARVQLEIEAKAKAKAKAESEATAAEAEKQKQVDLLAQAQAQADANNGNMSISAAFVMIAPEESKQLLTAMLQQATSAFKVSEIKGKIETFAKPATGDRKAARKLNDQGLAALKSDDFAQALAALKNATATDPADVEILNNYVFALIKAKRLQDAEIEAGRLLTISPGRSSAWANLAEVYALKNKNDEAVAALVLAFQFSSNKDRTVTFLNERAGDANSPLQATAKKTIEIIQKM